MSRVFTIDVRVRAIGQLQRAGLGRPGGISTHTTVDPWPLEE